MLVSNIFFFSCNVFKRLLFQDCVIKGEKNLFFLLGLLKVGKVWLSV